MARHHGPTLDALPDALRSRPVRIVEVEVRSKGSVSRGEVIEAIRFGDATLVDRMAGAGQLSERETRAGRNLLRIFTLAGMNPRVCATPMYVPDDKQDREEEPPRLAAGGARGEEALQDGETYRDRYRRILRPFAGKSAELLDGLMLELHPGTRWLATMQAALQRLADEWGYEKS